MYLSLKPAKDLLFQIYLAWCMYTSVLTLFCFFLSFLLFFSSFFLFFSGLVVKVLFYFWLIIWFLFFLFSFPIVSSSLFFSFFSFFSSGSLLRALDVQTVWEVVLLSWLPGGWGLGCVKGGEGR